MDRVKLQLLMIAFIKSQFNYCPLVWMFHDRTINSKVNKSRERALQIVCKDSGNDFVTKVNSSITTHQRILQLLMIEIFKTKNDLNPTFMKDIFAKRDNYCCLRNINHLQLPKVRTTIDGTENIQYRSCFLWSSLPSCLRDCSTIQEFKRKIKQWNSDSCTCRLCRVFIKDLGFLDYLILFFLSVLLMLNCKL